MTGNIEANMDIELFQSGEFKGISAAYKQMSDNERAYMREYLDSYQKFLTLVATDRNLNIEEYKVWAEGKIFLSDEALQLGLVDAVGTIFEAEEKMLELLQPTKSRHRFSWMMLIYFTIMML